MTQLSEQTGYAYAVGRIRSLEKHLLDRPTLHRLLEEPLPGVCRILEEHGFPPVGEFCGSLPEEGDEVFLSPEFDEIKDKRLKSTFTELEELSSDREITGLLPLRYDFLNLAWLLKAGACGADAPRLCACGSIDPSRLSEMLQEEGHSLPPLLYKAFRLVSPLVENGEDQRLIGAKVLGVYWRHFLNTARASGLEFLRLLAARRIDRANLSTFLRLKREGVEQLARLDEELVPGPADPSDPVPPTWEPVGLEPLSSAFFHKAWTEPVETLPALLAGTAYEKAAIEAASRGEGFDDAVFDRELENLAGQLIKSANVATFGVEPLLAFGVAREIEVSNLQLVLSGRAVGLAADRILEELRYGYV